MIIQHGSSSASCLGCRGPTALCLQLQIPATNALKHTQQKYINTLPPPPPSLSNTHAASLSFHSSWHQGVVCLEWQMTNSVPYSLQEEYSSPLS